jgi:hypothetical protein
MYRSTLKSEAAPKPLSKVNTIFSGCPISEVHGNVAEPRYMQVLVRRGEAVPEESTARRYHEYQGDTEINNPVNPNIVENCAEKNINNQKRCEQQQ